MLTNTALPLRSRERKPLVSPQTGAKRLTITSILVPLDFSPASFNALDFALPFAERFDASVHLVHVFDFDYPPSMLAAMPMIIPESRLAQNAKSRLEEIAKKLALSPDNVHVVAGRAYRAICELAGKIGTELIIAAASGQSALEHVLLGSTAERIAQHAPCPTLVVRGWQKSFFKTNGNGTAGRATHLRKILVPLDFSDCSMVGLKYAIRFAESSTAELVLLNSVSVPSFAPYGAYGDQGLTAANHYAWLTAEKEMSQLSSVLVALGINAEPVVESGVPAHQICLYAQNHEVDVIITATHGKTELKHCLLGSTAEQILRHAPCPVLVVPGKEKRAAHGQIDTERPRGTSQNLQCKHQQRRSAMTCLQRLKIR
jgi:nucleotide-binding universal stress UspA family protein